jgi:flagellar basal body rod protein FlgG
LIGLVASLFSSSIVEAMDEIMDISVSAMEREETRHRVLMDNVVNAKTPAYREVNTYSSLKQTQKKPRVKSYASDRQGPLVHTGRVLDIALQGPGFFCFQTEAGLVFSRDGRFKTDNENRLRSFSGDFLVLGATGPIIYDEYENTTKITETGKIIQDEVVLDTLLVANFTDLSQLKNVNGVFFCAKNLQDVQYTEDFRLKIGYLESSNVNLAKQLVDMPDIQKGYEVNSRIIQLRLKSLSTALELGKMQ